MNMNKLTYIRCGDYDIPNLKLSEQPETSIGKYGRMRKSYLKEHRPILYNQLLMSEKLYPHLLEIDRTAQERMDTMLPHMMEAAGVTEELKACDPMRWVGLMNTLTAQIEEILIREVFQAYLDDDPLYEVVQTSHGYTLMAWEPHRNDWYSAEIQKTPEDLRNALLGTYANFLEDKITGNDRELTVTETGEIQQRCRELWEKCRET